MKIFEDAGVSCYGPRTSRRGDNHLAVPRQKRTLEQTLAMVHRLDEKILATQEAELQQVVDDFIAEQEAGIPQPQLYGTVPHAILPTD